MTRACPPARAQNATVESQLRGRVAAFGLELGSIGVKDIALPGDMKTILNQVVEAEKAAEANLIPPRGDGRHAVPPQHRQGARGTIRPCCVVDRRFLTSLRSCFVIFLACSATDAS